jgi:succinate dehydrogenase / fumarate reductase cytochrome b subunit
MATAKRHPNRLGIIGWGLGGRWGIERYMYTVHRLTGLGLLAYFLLHILVTSTRAFGPEAWQAAMARVSNPVLRLGEFLVFVAFAIHALNGIRLILIELGWLVGPPEEPEYPYRTSLNVQRPFMIILMIVAAAIILLGGWDFLSTSHAH